MKKSQAGSRSHPAAVAPRALRTKPAAAPGVPATAKRTVPAGANRAKSGLPAPAKGPAAPVAAPSGSNLRRVVPKGTRTAAAPVIVVAPGKKGKKGVVGGKASHANSAANEAFMRSVIPTRIERLEILRQLYDKRKETPQKPGTAASDRPAEEEETEGEFVVSDEIVSSDSSEP